MKRQVQYAGVKKWAGSDIVECQSQPLEAIDRFFGQYGPHILQGCEVTLAGDRADISAGLAALEGKDAEGNDVRMVVPFEGVTGTVLPVYLTLSHTVRERPYVDGSVRPVAYDYKAAASAVKPADGTPYLEITAAGGLRFVDAVQDAAHRFMTDAERAKWNAAQGNAESHADSVAAEAEETAVHDAVLRTRLTGAKLDKGYFKNTDESLKFTGDRTIRAVFVTGADVTTRQGVFRDGYNNQHNTVSVADNWITGRVGGTSYQTAAQPDTLYEVVLVKTAGGCKVSVNGVVQNKALADNAAETRFIEVGNSENVPFFGRILSARVFNFAFTDADIASSWNGGHPELWRVPDVLRGVRQLDWPTAIYKPEAETWSRNAGNPIRMDNVAAANGFSGNFQRFEIPEGGTAISIYNAFQRYDGKTRRERQRVRFEYRSSGSVSARGLGSFAANTGDAVVAEIIGDIPSYMVIDMNGQPGGYIEIRTLAIDAVGCMLDLTPAGLTPTVWYDASGQAHDAPYFLNGNKAGEAELSCDTTGFADTTASDREAVLAYANRYDADREAVLVRMADANAGEALADHAADAVKHVTAAERSAWNAKETTEGAQEKADAAVHDAVLRTRLTGAVMGKGLFKSSAPALTTEVAGQPHTTVVLFVTPTTASSGNLSVYNEGADGNIGYGCHIFHTGSNVVVSMRGLQIAAKTVPLGTLCCAAVSYDGDTRCAAAINGTVTVKEAPAYVYPHEPQRFLLGGTEAAADTGTLPGVRLVAARRFNFALTAEELTAMWNGGHPELWVAPAVVRNIEPSQWPSGSFSASAGTWVQNNNATKVTGNVAAANGFSGAFQRMTNDTPGDLSVYNAWRLDNRTADMKYMQLIEFEYRSDGAVRAVHGGTVLATFPANTGSAASVSYIAPAGEYTSLSLAGSTGTYLEIRTLRIVTLGCLLDLTPAGLTPTVWYDASGQGHDVPYVAAEGNPAEAELSDSIDGFAAEPAAGREAVLAYANRYDADREAVFVRMADANAGQALADHAADTTSHVTATERNTWNAKADLDKTGHVTPQQIAPQQGRQQGVRTEYGYYKSDASSLNPEGPQTHVATFVTGDDVTTSQTVAAGKNFAFTIAGGGIVSPVTGGVLAPVIAGKLYQTVYVVDDEAQTASLYLNGAFIAESATFQASTALFIGRYNDTNFRQFKGTVVGYRQFSFAMRAEDVAEVWNGGRPTAWRVPTDYRKELPSSWPTSINTASAGTWRENHNSYMTYTPNVSAANGFSGAFERFTAEATVADFSLFNNFRYSAPDRNYYQYIRFEYRCDKPFKFTGSVLEKEFPANTGPAQIGYGVVRAGFAGNLFVDKGATYLEIRTLEITTLGLCTSAFEPESLLPEGWRNMIGGTDLEYTSYKEDSVAVFDYTVPEEPGTILLAKQYTDEREEQIRSDFGAADKTILAQAKAYSDSVTDDKQDTIPTITIADFDTFNPSDVASISGMPVGACCYFTSNGAVGRPVTITDSKVWCGRITKMSAIQYRIEAFNTSGSISTPQFATRLYTNTKVYDWQLLTEDMLAGTSGYAKLPGGLMLEWGKVAWAEINVQPVTVTFPSTFPGGIPYSISCIAWDGDNELDIRTFTVKSLSSSQMQVVITDMSGGSVGANGCTFLWQAIGKW